jgi:hypothetical protein
VDIAGQYAYLQIFERRGVKDLFLSFPLPRPEDDRRLTQSPPPLCSLVITGSRPPQAWSNFGGHITFAPADELSGQAVYHRRELAQGPYHASWAVPEGCDYDGVSAEFV